MHLFRLAGYFTFVQCCLAGAAFAGTVVVPVPEPATLALLAVGAGGIAVARKFRNRP